MKYIILLYILQIQFISVAQLKQPRGEQLIFTDIISTLDSSLAKDEIYSRVLEWSGDAFISSKAVIDVQDRLGGIIMLKAKMSVSYITGMGLTETSYGDYTVKISIKNGKVKSEIGPFLMDNVNFPGIYITTENNCGYKGMGKKIIQRIWEAYQNKAYDIHDNLIHTLILEINDKKEW